LRIVVCTMKRITRLLILAGSLLLVPVGATSALAQPTAPTAAPGLKRPKVVFHVDVPTAQMKVLKRTLSAIRRALKKDKRLRYRPIQSILEKPKGSLKRLMKADDLVAAGKKDLTSLEVGSAIKKFKKAVRLMQVSFVALVRIRQKTKPLARALRNLAIAYFLDGKAEKAKATLQQLLVLSPKIRYSAKLFPRQMAQLVDDERLMFDEFGTANVVVKTTPPGARIYLNARRVGRSPLTIKNVRRGFNYITARAPGYRTTTTGEDVDPPKLVRTNIKLMQFKRDPLPLMAGALLEMGKKTPGPGILGMAKRLKANIIVLARARAEHDQAVVTLYVYDVRLKKLMKGPVTLKPSTDFPKEKVNPGIRRLIDGIPLDGVKAKPKKKPDKKLWKKMNLSWAKFRKSKAFWPVIGGVAGAIVAGVVVGLVVGLSDKGFIPRGSRHVLAYPLAR
jgi:PEGA domain